MQHVSNTLIFIPNKTCNDDVTWALLHYVVHFVESMQFSPGFPIKSNMNVTNDHNYNLQTLEDSAISLT